MAASRATRRAASSRRGSSTATAARRRPEGRDAPHTPEGTEMSHSLLQELERHPFVADFPTQDRVRLAALGKQVRFAPGQVIFREGDDYSVFYLLGQGMVALELEVPGHVLRVQ